MKFVILTEGGNEYGIGHIVRCSSFYDAIKEKGHEIEFFIHGDKSIMAILEDRIFTFYNWHGNINNFLQFYNNYDFIILDSYYVSQEEANLLSHNKSKVIVIEDFIHRNYTNSIIVDWSIGAEDMIYYSMKNNSNQYLLGTNYVVLRKPFWNIDGFHNKQADSILVTLGGSDFRQLSKKICLALKQKFPAIEINLIVGPAFLNKKELLNLKIKGLNIIYSPNAIKLKEIMGRSLIAISGGGQTLYELAIMKIPIVAIELTDNQHLEIEEWSSRNGLIKAGNWDMNGLENNILEIIDSLLEKKISNMCISKTHILFDGNGINRIIDVLLNSISCNCNTN